MKKTLILLLFSGCISVARSQEKIPAFGKADRRELEMKECAFDKNANAVRLLDIETKDVYADYSLRIKTERRTRIKIFNEKGFDAATISIPYVSRIKGTRIADIDAYIYYLDNTGSIVTEKVSKDQIFRDKKSDDIKQVKFAFPNVKAGCVVEYRYEKIEKNALDMSPWIFQSFIPTLYSSFTLIMPARIPMDKRFIGTNSIKESSEIKKDYANNVTYIHRTYALGNIDAFKPEPFMTSVADNLKRVEFAIQPRGFNSLKTILSNNQWEIYAEVLNEVTLFGGQFNKPVPGTESILDSVKKINNREEKINFIFQRVKNHIIWDNHQTFYSGDLSEAWKERSGNSAEINLMILNLLRRSGIPCSPILISTRSNGETDPGFFSLSQFNGVNVLLLDSTTNYVLDGTRKYQSYKTPPENILNRSVFNADTAFANWVYITDTRPLLKTVMSVAASLTDSGVLNGSAVVIYHDHSKVQRMSEKDKTEQEKQEEEKDFLKKDFTELKIDSLVKENAEDDLKPLMERFNFSYQPSVSGKFLFLDPFFLSSFRKNPFTDSLRESTIDFNSKQYLKTAININIPDSYEVDFLPKNIRLRMADSSILFERIIYTGENKIYFVNTMEVLYPLFTKDEYPALRDFFTRMYGMVTEQIILKRKN